MTTQHTSSPNIIPLWSGSAPGSEDWDWPEQETVIFQNLKVVRNITHPTLTAYLPDPATSQSTAVIICPGGAFHFLSIDMEGHDVARWLSRHGVAAFVLKYRLIRTGDSFPTEVGDHLKDEQVMHNLMAPLIPLILADGQQAIRLVRQHAAGWNIHPQRIGIMGFSAGGTVTVNVALQHDAESRPDFAAPIYSAGYFESPVPADAPPLFLLCANDDEMATNNSIRLHKDWEASGHPVELHIYAKGGHGFGMQTHGLPTDTWIERFHDWLRTL